MMNKMLLKILFLRVVSFLTLMSFWMASFFVLSPIVGATGSLIVCLLGLIEPLPSSNDRSETATRRKIRRLLLRYAILDSSRQRIEEKIRKLNVKGFTSKTPELREIKIQRKFVCEEMEILLDMIIELASSFEKI